ncbi:hypothetical protein [Fibrella aquatica]|uniref:hypothetical protein n=1 Tax=Fibrella aquatica TaxID=3242487 RepID=UPI003522A5DE
MGIWNKGLKRSNGGIEGIAEEIIARLSDGSTARFPTLSDRVGADTSSAPASRWFGADGTGIGGADGQLRPRVGHVDGFLIEHGRGRPDLKAVGAVGYVRQQAGVVLHIGDGNQSLTGPAYRLVAHPDGYSAVGRGTAGGDQQRVQLLAILTTARAIGVHAERAQSIARPVSADVQQDRSRDRRGIRYPQAVGAWHGRDELLERQPCGQLRRQQGFALLDG